MPDTDRKTTMKFRVPRNPFMWFAASATALAATVAAIPPVRNAAGDVIGWVAKEAIAREVTTQNAPLKQAVDDVRLSVDRVEKTNGEMQVAVEKTQVQVDNMAATFWIFLCVNAGGTPVGFPVISACEWLLSDGSVDTIPFTEPLRLSSKLKRLRGLR